MTTVARRDPADKAKIDAIEEKLLANPEIAKLIDELSASTTDANDLVRGMLQASITHNDDTTAPKPTPDPDTPPTPRRITTRLRKLFTNR